ncbi:MAG: hypothetical protein AAF585_19150, partial [Verrucomicrobiota bacterium]
KVLEHISFADLEEANTLIADLRDNAPPMEVRFVVQAIAAKLGKDDGARTLKWLLENTTGTAENVALLKLAEQVADSNPEQLPELFEDMPAGGATERAIGIAAEGWAKAAPEDAKNWILNLGDQQEQGSGWRGLIKGLSSVDPPLAAKYLEDAMDTGIFPDEERFWLANSAFGAWAKKDRDAAASRASEIGDAVALRVVARSQVHRDFHWSIEKVQEIEDEADRQYAITELFDLVAADDPEKAFRFVVNSPREIGTPAAMRTVMLKWAHSNPEEASIEVRDMPPGPMRDMGADALVVYLTRFGDYDSAAKWAAEIRDVALKARALSWIEKGKEENAPSQ